MRALIFIIGLLLAWSAPHARAEPAPASIAPDFTLRSVNGPTLRLNELRGQVVLLTFWATWCAPCRAQLPLLSRLADRHRDGVVIVAVGVDADAETLAAATAAERLRFPVLVDDELRASRRYDLQVMPTVFVLDRDGRVRHVERGFAEWKYGLQGAGDKMLNQLDAHIVALLAS